jgi:hypothetical protein
MIFECLEDGEETGLSRQLDDGNLQSINEITQWETWLYWRNKKILARGWGRSLEKTTCLIHSTQHFDADIAGNHAFQACPEEGRTGLSKSLPGCGCGWPHSTRSQNEVECSQLSRTGLATTSDGVNRQAQKLVGRLPLLR